MAIVYQASDGRWLVFSNNVKSNYFNTESEAMIMSEKIKFAEEVQAFSNEFSLLIEKVLTFQSVFAHREYGSGQADEMTNVDLVSLGITAAEVFAFITPYCPEISNFMNNLPVVQGDYSATLNKLRTDI